MFWSFFTTIFRGSSAVICAVTIPLADLRLLSSYYYAVCGRMCMSSVRVWCSCLLVICRSGNYSELDTCSYQNFKITMTDTIDLSSKITLYNVSNDSTFDTCSFSGRFSTVFTSQSLAQHSAP